MNNRIPTLLGILSVTIGVIAGVLLVENRQATKLYAALDATPKNVRVTNVSNDTMTISWTTLKQTSGLLVWGKKRESLDEISGSSEKTYTHSYTLSKLEANSDYYFLINSDGTSFDNNGIPWQAKTGPKLARSPHSFTISGSVIDRSGAPVSEALVYVVIGGGSPMSTQTSENGNWVLAISEAREQNLMSYVNIDPEKTVIQLHVQTGKDAVTSGQLRLKSAQPAPRIILGDIEAFKNSLPENLGTLPEAKVILSTENEPITGFGELINATE
ncbi:hypothetical protein IPM62_00095 [Candidatus Woesebacteria bacterium]|nr:MAG: hypothetical protein IPM62_00095 [Candidatus Woesebacteria bacterium]